MQLEFDAATVKPRNTAAKRYDPQHLDGETFGLLTVVHPEMEITTDSNQVIEFWACACNCLAGFDQRRYKMASFYHLIKGHTWCCDSCKHYYKTPEGSLILTAAKQRMKWYGSELEEAIVDVMCEREVLQIID